MWWKILSFIIFLAFANLVLAGSAPTQTSPTDGSTTSSSTLTWQAPSYTLYSGNAYRVQVDDDSSFASINKDYYTANNTYSPTLTESTWYWRVKAKDSSGTWSDWSGVSQFILSTSSSSYSTPTSATATSTSTFTISGVPSQIDSTQSFMVAVNIELSSSPNTKFYLKGAFTKSGSTNYFGFTKVSGNWVKNGSSYSSQYEIQTDSTGKWSGNLEIQPDVLDSGYEGTNNYIFKIGKYTSSGSGPTWSNEVNIKINAKEVVTGDEVINLSDLAQKPQGKVLGEEKNPTDLPDVVYSLENYRRSATASSSPSASQTIEIKSEKQNLILPIIGGIFLGLGLGLGVYLFLKNRIKS